MEQRRRSFSTPGYLEPHQATSHVTPPACGTPSSSARATAHHTAGRVTMLGEHVGRGVSRVPMADPLRPSTAFGGISNGPPARGQGTGVSGQREGPVHEGPFARQRAGGKRKSRCEGAPQDSNPDLAECAALASIVPSPAWLSFETALREVSRIFHPSSCGLCAFIRVLVSELGGTICLRCYDLAQSKSLKAVCAFPCCLSLTSGLARSEGR